MGKAPTSDSIMAADKMKPLLALSKREPVQAAICLSTDGDGLILLDKKAKPRKVASMLRTAATKAKLQLNAGTIRFGRAEVDTEYDPGMVRFFINKDAPGNMRVKLVEVIKRIPYQKVEINVDPALEEEPEEEEGAQEGAAEAGEANGASPAAAATQPVQPASAHPTQSAGKAPPAVAAKPAQAARPDAGVLAAELAALARRIPEAAGADPAVKARLLKLATDTNVNIKTNNLNYAARFLADLRDALRDALDAAGVGVGQVTRGGAPNGETHPGNEQTTPGAGARALSADLAALMRRIPEASGDDTARKAALVKLATEANGALRANQPEAATDAIARLREALDGPIADHDADGPAAQVEGSASNEQIEAAQAQWSTALQRVATEVAALKKAAGSLFAGAPQETDVIDAMDELDEIVEGFDDRLSGALNDLVKRTDPEQRAAGVKYARELIAEYIAHSGSRQVSRLAGETPFGVNISIGPTIETALRALQDAVH